MPCACITCNLICIQYFDNAVEYCITYKVNVKSCINPCLILISSALVTALTIYINYFLLVWYILTIPNHVNERNRAKTLTKITVC